MTPGIATLLRMMPDGYEEACFSTGAIVRKRDIKSPDDLMMLCLFHLLTGCSLVEISELAKLSEIGDISDVAFMKRFQNCNEWFKWIISHIKSNGIIDYTPPEYLKNYRLLALDASDVREKGCSGRLYRLHFALDIVKMSAALYNITSQEVGEKLSNFDLKEKDLVLGDRIYSSVNGIEHCMNCGADFVLRVRYNGFHSYNADGTTMDLGEAITGSGKETGDINVFLKTQAGNIIPARVCYCKKDEEAIKATLKRIKKRDNKHQTTTSKEAKAFNEYIVVVTSLGETITAEEILDLYRYRWQVELYFKRLKSLLGYGELPKKKENSIFAWLNGKIMIALLIELVISKATFPPKGESFEEYLARDEEGNSLDDVQCT